MQQKELCVDRLSVNPHHICNLLTVCNKMHLNYEYAIKGQIQDTIWQQTTIIYMHIRQNTILSPQITYKALLHSCHRMPGITSVPDCHVHPGILSSCDRSSDRLGRLAPCPSPMFHRSARPCRSCPQHTAPLNMGSSLSRPFKLIDGLGS